MKELLRLLCIVLLVLLPLCIVSYNLGYTSAQLTFYTLLAFTVSSCIYVALLIAEEDDTFEDQECWFNETLEDDEDFNYHPDNN